MKRLALLLLLLAAPLQAQTTATFFLSSERNSDGGTFPSDEADLTTHFDSGSGFGVSVARRYGNLSGELAVFKLSSDASIRQDGTDVFSLGDVDLTPVTAMLR